MKLDTFIEESLNQVINGVKKAGETAQRNGAAINPSSVSARSDEAMFCIDSGTLIQLIEFDIAVSVKHEISNSESGKASVGEIVVEGSLEKVNLQNTSVHRIKFSLPVKMPSSS